MSQRIIPIFFSIDDAYAPYLAAALASAIDHADDNRTYRAIVLHENLSDEHQNRLSSLAKENFAIDFIPMQQELSCIDDQMGNRLRCDYFTLTIYYRLFIPAMFPEYDKGIYIDSDVIVADDLAKLFDTDLCGNYIGACTDLSVQEVPPLVRYMEDAVGVPRHQYINSGVLLMDLKALREKNLHTHFLDLLNTYHVDCIAPDQDYLNAICHGKILYLSPRWDVMPNDNVEETGDLGIVHYNLFSKPWCYDGIQYGDMFWDYAATCGYEAEILAHKAGYDEEKKAADAKCLDLLVNRGGAMPDRDITFHKLVQQGVQVRL